MKNNVSIFRYICLSNNTKSFVPLCLRHRVVRGQLGNLAHHQYKTMFVCARYHLRMLNIDSKSHDNLEKISFEGFEHKWTPTLNRYGEV